MTKREANLAARCVSAPNDGKSCAKLVRSEEGSVTIEGYGAVFDQEAYGEVIRRGAFSKTILERTDIRMLWNHNSEIVLASNGRAKTLRLYEDPVGLKYAGDPPSWASGHVETVERGDVHQSSFGFDPIQINIQIEEKEEENGDKVETILFEIVEVRLWEVSPVTWPWYDQTTSEVIKKVFPYEELRDRKGETLYFKDIRDRYQTLDSNTLEPIEEIIDYARKIANGIIIDPNHLSAAKRQCKHRRRELELQLRKDRLCLPV